MTQARPEVPDDAEWVRDEFAESLVETEDQLRAIFEEQLFFGCESDDRSVYRATDVKGNALNARLRPLFSSDAGHFDLPDMRTAVPTSHQLVTRGLLDDQAYAEFVFENAVRLYAGMNAAFFTGTAVEHEARTVLDATSDNVP